MLIPGLCSVTFRPLSPLDICGLAQQAGLKSIEWGGDVHVKDEAEAKEVAKMTLDHGLIPASYGSYFRAGGNRMDEFMRTVDNALALGASNIRVWAGTKGSAAMTGMERIALINELRECGEVAMAAGMTLSLEFHGGTITDTSESAGRLTTELGPCNVHMYWQPRWDWTPDQRLGSLMITMSRLTNIHIFTWQHNGPDVTRLPLADGSDFLVEALKLSTQDGNDHHVFMEFVEDGSEQAFMRDAKSLHDIIARVG